MTCQDTYGGTSTERRTFPRLVGFMSIKNWIAEPRLLRSHFVCGSHVGQNPCQNIEEEGAFSLCQDREQTVFPLFVEAPQGIGMAIPLDCQLQQISAWRAACPG